MDNVQQVDPRIQRSQEALITAMMELLHEKALQDISVSQITKLARVNRSTFYAHYVDKYDLFQACVRHLFVNVIEQMLPDADQWHCGTLKDLIIATCEFFGGMKSGCSPKQKAVEPIIETEVQSVLYDYLLTWMQSEDFPNRESTERLDMRARLMSWSIFGVGYTYRQSHNHTPEELATTAYQLLTEQIIPVAS